MEVSEGKNHIRRIELDMVAVTDALLRLLRTVWIPIDPVTEVAAEAEIEDEVQCLQVWVWLCGPKRSAIHHSAFTTRTKKLSDNWSTTTSRGRTS